MTGVLAGVDGRVPSAALLKVTFFKCQFFANRRDEWTTCRTAGFVEVFDADVFAVVESMSAGLAQVGGAIDAAAKRGVADDFAFADEADCLSAVAEKKAL